MPVVQWMHGMHGDRCARDALGALWALDALGALCTGCAGSSVHGMRWELCGHCVCGSGGHDEGKGEAPPLRLRGAEQGGRALDGGEQHLGHKGRVGLVRALRTWHVHADNAHTRGRLDARAQERKRTHAHIRHVHYMRVSRLHAGAPRTG